MIIYEDIEVGNLFSEGFEVTLSSAMTLEVTAGIVSMTSGDPTVRTYPAFSIDLEADAELDVIYDIYLLEEAGADDLNVSIGRTELGADVFPCYVGDTPLLHCLVSIRLPPGTTVLDDVTINVRNMKAIAEGAEPVEDNPE